jgi:hypothetical protein
MCNQLNQAKRAKDGFRIRTCKERGVLCHKKKQNASTKMHFSQIRLLYQVVIIENLREFGEDSQRAGRQGAPSLDPSLLMGEGGVEVIFI